MITDIQDADRRLLFLSAGEYSCGDPQDTRLKELVRSEFPDTYVNKHYNTAWNESIAFISTYADFLDNFAKTNAASQAKLTAVNEAADSLAAIIPAAAPLATLAKPAVTTAGAFQGAVAAAQVRNEAARLST
ncbi:MAG TPA: hypothetical protein VL202_03575, partial [Pararhizobium sp.]|uniref:hypothetical protein n=1 Tax=Pararhizobium sp. TaxID=1977563 RepID=UPI002CA8EF01